MKLKYWSQEDLTQCLPALTLSKYCVFISGYCVASQSGYTWGENSRCWRRESETVFWSYLRFSLLFMCSFKAKFCSWSCECSGVYHCRSASLCITAKGRWLWGGWTGTPKRHETTKFSKLVKKKKLYRPWVWLLVIDSISSCRHFSNLLGIFRENCIEIVLYSKFFACQTR